MKVKTLGQGLALSLAGIVLSGSIIGCTNTGEVEESTAIPEKTEKEKPKREHKNVGVIRAFCKENAKARRGDVSECDDI